MRVGIIERAYQMAESGQFHNLVDLQRQLGREGYEAVHMHLNGKHTRQQLVHMIAEAKAAGAERGFSARTGTAAPQRG
jgi:hypothetical protein